MADKAVRAVHMGDALMVAGIVVALASTLGWAGTLWRADTWDSPLLWLDAAALVLAVALFAAGFVVRRRSLRRGRLTPASFLGPEEERAVVEAIKRFELRTSGEIRVHLHGGRVSDVLAAARAAFGRLGMTATRERNGVLFFVATAQSVLRNDRIALHVHQRLFGSVDSDPIKPGVELGITPKLVKGAIGANEGFLGNVLHQVHITHHPSDQALNAPLILDDQQFICSLIARNCALHQLEIAVSRGRRRGCSHGHSGITPQGSRPWAGWNREAGAAACMAGEYTARRTSNQRWGKAAFSRCSHTILRPLAPTIARPV